PRKQRRLPMKKHYMLIVLTAAAIVILATPPLQAELLEKTKKVGNTTVTYKVVLPDGYDAAKSYPGILALGGGPQTMNTVDNILNRNFRADAEKRGYIVIAPAAPDGQLFFENGARVFPEFLKMILADYKIQDNKFHIPGPSNGGIAAFHVAAANPQYFLSVTAFPGYMWEPNAAKLQAISKMCVFMYVGESDEYMWHGEMQREAEFLRSKGTVARYTVEKGQPHRLDTLAGPNAGRLFEGFEETKKGCTMLGRCLLIVIPRVTPLAFRLRRDFYVCFVPQAFAHSLNADQIVVAFVHLNEADLTGLCVPNSVAHLKL